MRIRDIIRLAMNNVFRGKIRTALTICSISIGVASVVLVLSLGDGSRAAVSAQMDKLGLEGIMLYPKQTAVASGIHLSAEDASELMSNISGVDKAMPVMLRYGSYKIKNWQGNALIYGIDASMREVLKIDLLYGRLPNRLDINSAKPVAIINETFAQMIYLRKNIVGKVIKVFIGSAYQEFEIIGVISSQDDGLSQLIGEALPEFIYIPYSTAMHLSGDDHIDEIILKSNDSMAGERAASYLSNKYGSSNSFKYENITGIRDKVDNVIGLIALFISAIAAISIVVAGIGIMNTMMSAAIERKHEIGIYLTLGASGRDILLSFLAESAIISAVGGLIGIIVVAFPIRAASVITDLAFQFNASYIIIAEAVSIFCGILFGVSPAIRAAAMNPIDAIRSE